MTTVPSRGHLSWQSTRFIGGSRQPARVALADSLRHMQDRLARRRLFGLDFLDAPDTASVVELLLGYDRAPSDDGLLPVLVTPNVDQLVKVDAGSDPVATEVVRTARYVIADGQPIVWASRLLGAPLATRLAGSMLLIDLWPRLIAGGTPVLVVASSDEIADLVRRDHPGAVVVVAPQLRVDDPATFIDFADRCIAAIDPVATVHVFVTLGYPRRERLIRVLIDQWPAEAPYPLFSAVGASFEMLYGLKKRAPRWMQRAGLEWFFRFLQEPRRLFRRYFVDDMAFFPLVWREWRRTRRAR